MTLLRGLGSARALFAMACLSLIARADNLVPVGFLSYDVTGTNVAELDITNLTGPNSLPPDFPVTNSISMSDLNLKVFFTGGVSESYGPSYFTLGSDGLSFNGDQLSTLSGPPTGLLGATSATLTGDFDQSVFDIGGFEYNVYRNFSVTLTDPSGLLSDGDFAIIDATTTPEPASWILLCSILIGLLAVVRTKKFKRRHTGLALGLGCLLFFLPGASQAQTTVALSTSTIPSTGASGGNVSITGSGFPSGTIAPGDVSITVASTCGGAGTSATAISVLHILGSVYKVEFTVPGLNAGMYYVSISGTTESSNAFSSNSSCSALTVASGISATLSIDTSRGNTDWVIKNGALTIDFNANSGAIWSIVPAGTNDQLIDFSPGNAVDPHTGSKYDPLDGESAIGGTAIPAAWSGPSGIPGLTPQYFNKEPKGFYMDLSGFTSVTSVPTYTLTTDYLDFAAVFPASGISPTNTTEYEEHFVVTPNDPGIHIYFSLNHPAQVLNSSGVLVNNGSGTIGGQVQWIWRGNVNEFTNYYQLQADLSMVTPVITPLPSTDNCFAYDPGRNDQDNTGYDTIDLHPQVGVTDIFSPYPNGTIPQGFHRHFCVKYDYSSYEYIHDAHGLFGSKYGQWVVFTPGHDTMIDGPSKENLSLTGNILTIEPNSNHYRTGGVGTTSLAAGTAAGRIYGPYYVRINQFGMPTVSTVDGGTIQTPDDMFSDALAAAASFTNFYNNESVLVSKGYVPTTQRGSVSVQVNGVSGAPRTAWAVLSQNATNQENSTLSYQYTIDISANGTGTFTNVVPGTYRLSVFDFGQWGEYRQDNVVVTAGNATTLPMIAFQPENFGTVVGTIGTPDRSSHEFLHGAYTQDYADGPKGYDDREYHGAWNYWADFASNNGAAIYNLTNGPGYSATNNPLAWNYAHWAEFDPGLYGGACVASDDTTDGYKYTGCTSLGDTIGIPAYVSSLSGASGTNGITTKVPAWQIHFTLPSNPTSGYVVLSEALASSQAPLSVSLNGTTALTYTPGSSHYSDAVERSGLSGYTEWAAFQWPVSALNAANTDNVITISVSASSTSCDSDDALRLELSTLGANPTVTGWNDYAFVTSGTTVAAKDTVPNQ